MDYSNYLCFRTFSGPNNAARVYTAAAAATIRKPILSNSAGDEYG